MCSNSYSKNDFAGRKYAEHAYELDQGNFEALRWTAILIGSFTEYLGPKQKIEQGKVFKVCSLTF